MDPAQALLESEIARNRIIDETTAHGDSTVQRFYADAIILVTGGSGFLGKQLIEKLFRSCGIKIIYVLLRSKKQKTIQERLAKMLEDEVFKTLQKSQPDFADRIVPVEGDVMAPRLGISERDWRNIAQEVSIIFHGAATVNFADPLKLAAMTNVYGTRELLLLAKECKKLRSFVYISTAYTHATAERSDQPVLEQFYDSPIAPDALIQIVQGVDEAVLDVMTPQIIKGWPNTYSFTKAVAEEVVRTTAGGLPICIVRPAIVICAYREPLPAWLDSSTVLGASGFVVGSGLGILHVLYADNNTILDLVPVDVVNNAVIVAAQETAAQCVRSDERGESDQNNDDIKIYTVSSYKNPIVFGRVVELITLEGSKFSTILCVWYGYAIAVKNKLLYKLLFFLIHYLPGFLVDGVLLMLGKKTMLTRVYNKVYRFNSVLGYYTTNTFQFGDSNLRRLHRSLSPADRTIFNCNMDSLDWKKYIVLWCIGCRKYIIRDGLKDTEKAVRKQFIFRILNYIIAIGYLYVIYKIVSVIAGAASRLFSYGAE